MAKRSAATKEAIVRACLETLREEGFARTSARAVARRGEFGQALIYYHFEDLQALLVATLEKASTDRLTRYREVLEPVATVSGLAAALQELYREDVAIGHVAAVQEIVSGATSLPGLGRQVIELLRPWAEFATETMRRFLAGTPFEAVVPAEEAAFAALALYMGMETMTHLNGDREPGDRLLEALQRLAPLADSLREAYR